MNKTLSPCLLFFCVFVSISLVNSQNPEWINYTCGKDINSNKWVGTYYGGVAVFKEGGVVEIKDIKKPQFQKQLEIVLHQSYPITRISYSILKQSHIVLKVYDIKGRVLKTLLNCDKKPGTHQINLNCSNMSSGTYFINLRVGNNSITKRMVILK